MDLPSLRKRGVPLSGMLARDIPGWQVIAFAVAISLPPSLLASMISGLPIRDVHSAPGPDSPMAAS